MAPVGRSSTPWARRYLERLEAEGASRGRPRRPNETAAAYATVLAKSVLPERDLAEVAAVLDTEAYAPHGASEEDRARAETALVDAVSRWPA